MTRTLDPGSIFRKLLFDKGNEVKGIPFIQIDHLSFELPKTEWIFFSSRNSVRSVCAKHTLTQFKIGALSTGTANELNQFGLKADFIGNQLPTPDIATQFLAEAKPKSIFFPIGNRSKRNIQKTISDLSKAIKIEEAETYITTLKPTSVKQYDVVVFTSPSQVESYFSINKWNPLQVAAAIGDSTQTALIKQDVTKVIKAWGYSDWALVDAV